jgi:hypothetical protein
VLGQRDPWRPRGSEEDTCDLKSAGRPPWQNDSLECVKRYSQAAEQSADKCCDVHEKGPYVSGVTIFVNLTRRTCPFEACCVYRKREGMTTQERFLMRTVVTCRRNLVEQWGQVSTAENSSVEKIVYSFDKNTFSGLS